MPKREFKNPETQTVDNIDDNFSSLTLKMGQLVFQGLQARVDQILQLIGEVESSPVESLVVKDINHHVSLATIKSDPFFEYNETETAEEIADREASEAAIAKQLEIQEIEFAHEQRLEAGIEYEGERYPCLKKDRDGIAGIIAGFKLNEELFDAYIAANGPPETPGEIEAMVTTGAVPPEYRKTMFQWSDGRFLLMTPEIAIAVSGRVSVYVSRSFSQKQAEMEAAGGG